MLCLAGQPDPLGVSVAGGVWQRTETDNSRSPLGSRDTNTPLQLPSPDVPKKPSLDRAAIGTSGFADQNSSQKQAAFQTYPGAVEGEYPCLI